MVLKPNKMDKTTNLSKYKRDLSLSLLRKNLQVARALLYGVHSNEFSTNPHQQSR